MTLTKLAADRVGLPVFEFSPRPDADIFDFSSHMRAKEALEFALRTSAPGYNVFVVGGERSGRMTATLAFLQEAMHGRAVPDDWVYLNNFTHSHRPRPARLPAGGGRILRDQMDVFVRRVAQLTMQIFDDESFRTAIEALAVKVRTDLDGRLAALRKEAKEAGFELLQTAEGFALALVDAEGKQVLPTNASAEQQAAAQKIGQSLGELTRDAARQQTALAGEIAAFSRRIAGNAFAPLLAELKSAYADHATISRWLVELENDLMQHLDRLREAAAAGLEGIATLDQAGVKVFDVSEEAEAEWIATIESTARDASAFMAACTPSRLNFEGDPSAANPRNGSYGGGYGDFYGWQALLKDWRERGDFPGLELDEPYEGS